jgi:hypothetical protein
MQSFPSMCLIPSSWKLFFLAIHDWAQIFLSMESWFKEKQYDKSIFT